MKVQADEMIESLQKTTDGRNGLWWRHANVPQAEISQLRTLFHSDGQLIQAYVTDVIHTQRELLQVWSTQQD